MTSKIQFIYLMIIIGMNIGCGFLIDPIHHNFSYLSTLNHGLLLLVYHVLCGCYLLIYTKKWMNVIHSSKKLHILAYLIFACFIFSGMIPYQGHHSLLSKWHTRISLLAFVGFILFFIYLLYISYKQNRLKYQQIQLLSIIFFIAIMLYFYTSHISYLLEAFLMIALCYYLYDLLK